MPSEATYARWKEMYAKNDAHWDDMMKQAMWRQVREVYGLRAEINWIKENPSQEVSPDWGPVVP